MMSSRRVTGVAIAAATVFLIICRPGTDPGRFMDSDRVPVRGG